MKLFINVSENNIVRPVCFNDVTSFKIYTPKGYKGFKVYIEREKIFSIEKNSYPFPNCILGDLAYEN